MSLISTLSRRWSSLVMLLAVLSSILPRLLVNAICCSSVSGSFVERRIKTQTVLPSADTAAMLFWALLASGQISMRKVDGWHTLSTKLIDRPIDLAA
jgi:hypothetical protein